MTADCENADSLEFTPFNDTDQPRIQQMIIGFETAKQGMNTIQIDPYRQGVSIRTPRHLYIGMQPKMGSGHPCHFTRVNTIGQSRDFTQFEESPLFEELPRFNPVWYLTDPTYPYPIVFNQGPQQVEESVVEPFTIPFRMPGDVQKYYVRGVHANIGSGNPDVELGGGNDIIEQCIEYNPPLTIDPFLDEGQAYFGDGPIQDDIVLEGYVPYVQRNIDPFNDTKDESIVARLNTSDAAFINAVKQLDFDLSEDIRGSFSKKSATAGSVVYGDTCGRYGTDSIAYLDTFRGSAYQGDLPAPEPTNDFTSAVLHLHAEDIVAAGSSITSWTSRIGTSIFTPFDGTPEVTSHGTLGNVADFTNGGLKCATLSPTFGTTPGYTVYVVLADSVHDGSSRYIFGNSSYDFTTVATNLDTFSHVDVSPLVIRSVGTFASDPLVLAIVFDKASNTATGYGNGVKGISANYNQGDAVDPDELSIGRWFAGGFGWPGKIAEIIVANRLDDDAKVASETTIFMNRWGF